MKIVLSKALTTKEIYEYMSKLDFPYNYGTDFCIWESSYLYDIDGEGRTLFSELESVGAYVDNILTGFIQYGKTAFGFDDKGEITDTVSYPVIRSLYFDNGKEEVGRRLLLKAIESFDDSDSRIYAFFHYFGMSCYARHGKLFEKFGYVYQLLEENGFKTEHENVFYSSVLNAAEKTLVKINWHDMTLGRQ